jgi:hypothetical protein
VIDEMKFLDEEIDSNKYSSFFSPVEIERMKTSQLERKRREIHGKYVIDKRTYNCLNSKAKRFLDNKNYRVQVNFDSLHTSLVEHGNLDSLSLFSIEIKTYPSFCVFTEKQWQGMLSGGEDRRAYIYVFGLWFELKSFRKTSFY